jgi:hypothetical protein
MGKKKIKKVKSWFFRRTKGIDNITRLSKGKRVKEREEWPNNRKEIVDYFRSQRHSK